MLKTEEMEDAGGWHFGVPEMTTRRCQLAQGLQRYEVGRGMQQTVVQKAGGGRGSGCCIILFWYSSFGKWVHNWWSEWKSLNVSESLQPHGLYTVHEARILEWVLVPYSKGSSQPSGQTQVSHIQADSLPAEPPGILEWVAYPFPSRSSWPRNRTGVSCIAGGSFTNWAIREAPGWYHNWLVFIIPPFSSKDN